MIVVRRFLNSKKDVRWSVVDDERNWRMGTPELSRQAAIQRATTLRTLRDPRTEEARRAYQAVRVAVSAEHEAALEAATPTDEDFAS